MSLQLPNFTPYVPSDAALVSSQLPDRAMQLSTAAAQLTGQVPCSTREQIIRHMAVINSYYSNLIEGNNTMPHEIRAAQVGEFSVDPVKRDLQLESIAHIHVQNWLSEIKPDLNTLYSTDFIQSIHREFYKQVPLSLHRIHDKQGNIVDNVSPGNWREHEVTVGRHKAPSFKNITALMEHFCSVYHPSTYVGDRKIISVICAHHRLAWIHPFADGNGRVMRLFTDAALKAIGVQSNGVWCLSRGLARPSRQYKLTLANADSPRQGDYDGRGVLSERTLMAFCGFMIDTAIDQVCYMSNLLTLTQMHQRIKNYVQARIDGRIPELGKLKMNATNVLYNAFITGGLSRSFAIEACGMPERSARRLLAQLKKEGLLSEISSRSDLIWEIPSHAEPWYFPQLYPYS